MTYKRRDFIKMGSSMMAGLALAPLAGSLTGESLEPASRIKKFGLQLYSLRDVLPNDPKSVLKQVASFGYKQAEGYEGPKGIFWGMSNTDFKKYMDDIDLNFVATHCNIDVDFEKKAAEAAAIGMKYLICPSRGQKTIEDFRKVAADFNVKGEICRKNGIRFAYHNHEYSFKEMEGQLPQDVMMSNTDPELVDFEMDIYWVVTGKQDPIDWLNKYPNRFKLCHIKDRIKGATERDASCTLGEGSIDYPVMAKTLAKKGMKYFIVEQERYDNSTSLACAEADAAYLKKMRF